VRSPLRGARPLGAPPCATRGGRGRSWRRPISCRSLRDRAAEPPAGRHPISGWAQRSQSCRRTRVNTLASTHAVPRRARSTAERQPVAAAVLVPVWLSHGSILEREGQLSVRYRNGLYTSVWNAQDLGGPALDELLTFPGANRLDEASRSPTRFRRTHV